MGQRGFTRPGEAGEPEDGTAMAILCFAARAGDRGVMPDDVGGGWGLGGHVGWFGLVR